MNDHKPVSSTSASSTDRLSFGEKFSYGVGDFASNMSWTLVSAFLMFFYTDVYGLTPAVVGVLLLVARVWDGINDPIMGLIMERIRSRFGRFRPYLLYAPVVMAVTNILTFSTFPLGPTGKIVYAYATYLCLIMAYTAVNVPYGALSTVMTQDHHERTSLNSFRMFSYIIASIVIGTLTMPLIQKLGSGNMQRGFFLTALTYSLLTVPLFWLVFRNCREVVTPPKDQKLSLKDSYTAVVDNKPLLLVLTYGFSSLSIAKRIGKRLFAIASALVGMCGLLIIYFSDYTNIPLITFGSVILGLNFFGAPLMYIMTADCIEFAEWKSGVRAEGIIYAATSLMTKLASAIVGSVGMLAIGVMGYVPNADQTALALKGINIMCNLVPGIMLLLSVVPMLFYKIDNKFYDKMVVDIYQRRTAVKTL